MSPTPQGTSKPVWALALLSGFVAGYFFFDHTTELRALRYNLAQAQADPKSAKAAAAAGATGRLTVARSGLHCLVQHLPKMARTGRDVHLREQPLLRILAAQEPAALQPFERLVQNLPADAGPSGWKLSPDPGLRCSHSKAGRFTLAFSL